MRDISSDLNRLVEAQAFNVEIAARDQMIPPRRQRFDDRHVLMGA
jgi:hypothetical protein